MCRQGDEKIAGENRELEEIPTSIAGMAKHTSCLGRFYSSPMGIGKETKI